MRTTKISISIDKKQLRQVRAAAKSEGLSVSAFIARALDGKLEEHDRLQAARELWAEWGPKSVPTEQERQEFRRLMARPRKRRSRAA
jgi:hypothetical protein